jgi:glycosyltransferase involved in cell wall biosynthesis
VDHHETITVIISAYQRPAELNRTLRSVYRQSYTDWRVLIVADCCSVDYVAAVDLSHPRVEMLNLPLRCGNQYGPNSVGIHRATTPWIAFLNHDDLWLPDHLEIALDTLRAQQADLFLGKAAFCHSVGQERLVPEHGRLFFSETNQPDRIWRLVSGPNWVFEPASSWVVRTALAQQVGYWSRPDTLEITTVMDWLRRCCRAGANFCFSPLVSALKLNLHHAGQGGGSGAYQQASPFADHIEQLLAVDAQSLRSVLDQDLPRWKELRLLNRIDGLLGDQEANIKGQFAEFCASGALPSKQPTGAGQHALKTLQERTGEAFAAFLEPEQIIAAVSRSEAQ